MNDTITNNILSINNIIQQYCINLNGPISNYITYLPEYIHYSPLLFNVIKIDKKHINEFNSINEYINNNNILFYYSYFYKDLQVNASTKFLQACYIRYYAEQQLKLNNKIIHKQIHSSYQNDKQKLKKKINLSLLPNIISSKINYKYLTSYLTKNINQHKINNIKISIINIICKYYIKYDILFLNNINIQPYINNLTNIFKLNDNDMIIISNYIANILDSLHNNV